MKNILLILFLLPLIGYSQVMTLEQCIDSAILNNLMLKKAVLNENIASVALQSAKQNNLPSVNANATHGYNWGQTIDPFTNQFATNRVQYDNLFISSSVTLFAGLQGYYSVKSNGISKEISMLNHKVATRNLKIDVTAFYLQVLLNSSIYNIALINKEKTIIQLNRIKELKIANQATKSDVLEIESQLSLDEYKITKAKNDVIYSKLMLRQLMNSEIDENFEIEQSVLSELNLISLETANDSLLNGLPEIIAVQLSLEKQLVLLKSIKGRYYPSLLLNGSLGSGYSGNNQMIDDNGSLSPKPFVRQLNENFYQTVQLTLSIPVFNKNAIKNQVKSANFQLQSLYLDKENEFNLLKQRIEQLKMEVLNEVEQYSALMNVFESFQLNFQNFQTRFANGDANYSQLAEAQNGLFNAQNNLVQSEFRLKLKSTLLGFYFGEDF